MFKRRRKYEKIVDIVGFNIAFVGFVLNAILEPGLLPASMAVLCFSAGLKTWIQFFKEK